MSCNCMELLKEEVAKRVKNMDKFKDLKPLITDTNSALIIEDGGKVKVRNYTQIEAKAYYTTQSGNTRTKKETFNFIHKYCPHCGKKLGEEQ